MRKKYKILKTGIKLSKLRKELLAEEAFDCLKDSIRKTTVRAGEQITRGQRRKRNRKERRQRRVYKRLTYNKYIASDLWTSRKNKFFKNHKRQCCACSSFERIHLHHAVYGEYGFEEDKHLFPLCERCHTLFHTLFKTKSNMLKKTKQFVSDAPLLVSAQEAEQERESFFKSL